VSSVLIHPSQRQVDQVECARLIPGEYPVSRTGLRKPPQSVRLDELSRVETGWARSGNRQSMLNFLMPHPFPGRNSWSCAKSVAADTLFIVLAWFVVGVLSLPLRVLFPGAYLLEFTTRSSVFLLGISLLHAALITLIGFTEGLYTSGYELRRQVKQLGKAVLLGSMVLSFAYGLQGIHWSVVALVCIVGLVELGALCLWRWNANRKRSDGDTRNVLIVGSGSAGRRVAAYIEGNPRCGRRMCGFLDDEKPLGSDVIGRISDLAFMARKGYVDEVILAAPHDGELTLRVLREARRLRLDVEIVPELFGSDPAEPVVEQVGGLPVICVHAEQPPLAELVMKRIIDIIGAGFGLAILSPLLVFIAVLIKVDSCGPIFYSAKRAGRKGRPFRCYKFRTMVTDADRRKKELLEKNQRSGPIFKIFDDPRITRLGRLLRRYSLDELPQLWNVIRGEMSLVGPRPHPVDEFASYELCHLSRLDVTPGLTGLWQVSARRDPSFDHAMELDREYIRSWNLALDLRILMKTVFAVARGSGN